MPPRRLLLSILVAASPHIVGAAVLQVGPGRAYDKPCSAIRAAAPGDRIEIDAAGIYDGDVCGWTTNNLTLRGVGGRPRIDAAGRNAQGKGTWVITGNDTVVDNIEFTGAAVADRNGAGIRQEGRNLTVRNCYFHDNEEGILAGDSPGSQILIEYSEFDSNGAGDGFSHNIYVNHVARFTLQFSYSHRSNEGHLVKSRAAENRILYNRLSDETAATSYEIDLPNGGRSYIVGNMIQQGPAGSNSTIVAYREEGPNAANPDTSLFVINNTIVNDRAAGGTFLAIAASTPTSAVVANNIFQGRGTVTTQGSARMTANLSGVDPLFRDAANYDYRLNRGSPAIDSGSDPGSDDIGTPLAPVSHYVPFACGEGRRSIGVIDAGAFEYQGSDFDAAAPARCRRIARGGVVNGADFIPGPVAPGSIIAIFGSNLAASGDLPQSSVTINGLPAPVLFASPAMLAVQVPYEIEPGSGAQVGVQVNVQGVLTEAESIEIVPAAPAIFITAGDLAAAPAPPGTSIVVYLTGVGAVQTRVETGAATPPEAFVNALLPAGATVGGQPAELRSLRLTPGLIGVAQAVIVLPQLPADRYLLTVTVGDSTSAPAPVVLTPAAVVQSESQ